jgi:hypothetical protein
MRAILITTFCWILALPLAAQAQDALRFEASDDGWAIVTSATGRASEIDNFVRVELEQMKLSVGKTTTDPVSVRSYKVGLAYGKPNGGWTVDRWSDTLAHAATLTSGQSILLNNIDTLVAVDGLPTLRNHWLVIAVEVRVGNQISLCYAHNKAGRFARN